MSKFNVRLEHRAKDEEVEADFFAFESGFILFKKKVNDQSAETVAGFSQHGVEFIKKEGQP